MTDNDHELDQPDEVALLLPWYANNTLAAPDRERVESALAGSPELRAELAALRTLGEAVVEQTDAIQAPTATTFDVLWHRIQADARANAAPERRSAWQRAGAALAGLLTPAILRPALAVAVVLLVVQAIVIAGLGPWGGTDEGGYTTATGDGATGGPHFFARFRDDLSMAALNDFLDSAEATVVRGPLPGGVYEIAVEAADDAADGDALLERLRAAPATVSVQRAM